MRELNEVLREFYDTELFAPKYYKLLKEKTKILETLKPSTREMVMYYFNYRLDSIPLGFTSTTILPDIPFDIGKRSYFEYNNGLTRHPIPYCLVRHEDKYYITFRESGSTEARLAGKYGMLGGHVSKSGIERSMYRELKEEAGITNRMISSANLKGLIKLDGTDVNKDHLGIIYEVILKTDKIRMEESGILKGMWVTKSQLFDLYSKMEDWSQIVFDNLIRGN